ncbi:MAG: hypothetical protein GY803_14615 [Chloroflexi bacterium]|nr:hypothetical protein [Chloroflexota bacterium]
MFRKTAFILFPLLALLALLGGTLAAREPRMATSLATPTYQTDPIGVEIPLGRYSEPTDLLLESEGVASAPSALNGAAPTIGTNFDGVGMEVYGGGYISSPPDTHSATGLDRIVEVTNGHVAIYDKSGGLIAGGDTGAGAVSLNDFCGSAGPPTEDKCYDPKVIYDQASDRFVAIVLQGKTAVTSILHVMVSKTSSPANLTSDWDKFSHSASANISGTDGWFDYPGLGVSPDAVVVTGNIFPDGGGSALGTKIRVFDKTELYDGDATATYQDIDNTLAAAGFTIQPAHHLSSPPSGTFYLFSRLGPTYLIVYALTGTPASPSLGFGIMTTSDQGTCVATAPQMGTPKELDTVCPRMMNAVWRDGSLWGALTGSDATDSRAVVQWFEIETNGYPSGTPSLRQHGAIDGGAGEFTFMPSIAVDADSNAAMTYSQSSGSRYPEMRYTGRAAGDALNTMRDPAVAKTSVSFHDDFTGPPERWGDYSSTVVDPSDGSFWVSHEYVKVAAFGGGNNGRWGTWHANFTFQASSTSGSTAWVQTNYSGFDDDPQNEAVLSLVPFNGELWAGTYNSLSGNGFQLWRLNSSGEWYPEWEGKSTYSNTVGISHMIVFSDTLFTGSWNETDGGSVFSFDGVDWLPVSDFGFGDPTNGNILRFAIFDDMLYAGTVNTNGGEIWRCQICDGSDWAHVMDAGFGDANNNVVPSFAVFGDTLYAGTINVATGGEVWSSTTGNAGTWSQVNSDGFGTANNLAISALAVFNNALYASTAAGDADFGAQVWRCQVCDGSDWSRVVDNGFGDMDTNDMSALEVFDEQFYFVVGNFVSGLQVWRTADGTNWAQVGFAGFGNVNNRAPNWDNSVAVYNGNLYVGAANGTDGGEVWLYLHETVYLPTILRND